MDRMEEVTTCTLGTGKLNNRILEYNFMLPLVGRNPDTGVETPLDRLAMAHHRHTRVVVRGAREEFKHARRDLFVRRMRMRLF